MIVFEQQTTSSMKRADFHQTNDRSLYGLILLLSLSLSLCPSRHAGYTECWLAQHFSINFSGLFTSGAEQHSPPPPTPKHVRTFSLVLLICCYAECIISILCGISSRFIYFRFNKECRGFSVRPCLGVFFIARTHTRAFSHQVLYSAVRLIGFVCILFI